MSFGWQAQRPDHRDRPFAPKTITLPAKFSLRDSPHNGATLDQGQLGTCVPNSNADMHRFVLSVDGLPVFLPSRLYIYAKGRDMEGTPLTTDGGMVVRDALKVLAAGVPAEIHWVYSDKNPGRFSVEPAANLELQSHAIEYLALNPQGPGRPLRSCLVEGFPFTFGFSVPAGLQSDAMASGTDPLLRMPGPGNELLNEGHGVMCVGYDYTCQRFSVPVFEIKQTWGLPWGDAGYFWMDARYFNKLASDLWTIRSVS